MLWFKLSIHRISFISWLLLHQSLPTRDVIRSYAPATDSACVLCDHAQEDHAHLFFNCSYYAHVIQFIFVVAGIHSLPLIWNDLVAFILYFNATSIQRKESIEAYVHYIGLCYLEC